MRIELWIVTRPGREGNVLVTLCVGEGRNGGKEESGYRSCFKDPKMTILVATAAFASKVRV